MPMTGFFCQDDYLEKVKKLDDQEVGRMFRALMDYHANGVLTELEGRESIAFDFIRADIDKAEAAYQRKCEQASKNRQKGLTKATNDDSRQRALTDDNGGDHVNINKCNDNKCNDNTSGKNIVRLRRFEAPTVEAVRAYCDERGTYLIDPQRFVDYYETRGWMLTNNRKMVDWKAAVRTWEKNERDRRKERTVDDLPY